MRAAASMQPSSVSAVSLGSTGSPRLSHSSLNFSRSSASSMLSTLVPSTSTRHSARTPSFCSSTARFSPVWPPMPGTMASGRS